MPAGTGSPPAGPGATSLRATLPRAAHGAVEALELGDEEEHVGTQRTEAAVLEQLAHDRPGALSIPRRAVGASGDQRPAMALADLVRRCHPQRRLGQLGRARRAGPAGSDHRRIIHRGGDDGIRLVGCEREMTGAHHWIWDEGGDPFVHHPALRSEIVVEHRRKQWVGKPNRSGSRSTTCAATAGPSAPSATPTRCEERLRRRPQRRRNRERSARLRRKAVETGADKLLQHGWNQQRLERVDIIGERASKLYRKEWVPARLLMYA